MIMIKIYKCRIAEEVGGDDYDNDRGQHGHFVKVQLLLLVGICPNFITFLSSIYHYCSISNLFNFQYIFLFRLYISDQVVGIVMMLTATSGHSPQVWFGVITTLVVTKKAPGGWEFEIVVTSWKIWSTYHFQLVAPHSLLHPRPRSCNYDLLIQSILGKPICSEGLTGSCNYISNSFFARV